MNATPLRYPGGKSILFPFFVDLFEVNNMTDVVYAEPYAGGAGAALKLLLNNKVSKIYLNDANIGIYSFWYYLVNESDKFIDAIDKIPVTLDEWFRQKQIFKIESTPSFDLGIATFFLCRTNRSGIISAGPIGGNSYEKQRAATYKIDCRFNKKDLIEKLIAISKVSGKINVSNLDALAFLRQLSRETFVYLDPPYYEQGSCLYMNYYQHGEHQQLADFLLSEAKFKWLLSYDDVEPVRAMYKTMNMYSFQLQYNVQTSKKGREIITHSRDLIMPIQQKNCNCAINFEPI